LRRHTVSMSILRRHESMEMPAMHMQEARKPGMSRHLCTVPYGFRISMSWSNYSRFRLSSLAFVWCLRPWRSWLLKVWCTVTRHDQLIDTFVDQPLVLPYQLSIARGHFPCLICTPGRSDCPRYKFNVSTTWRSHSQNVETRANSCQVHRETRHASSIRREESRTGGMSALAMRCQIQQT
jgi:hypothetical protein